MDKLFVLICILAMVNVGSPKTTAPPPKTTTLIMNMVPPDNDGDNVADDVDTLKTLLATLQTDYDTRIRPIANQSDSVVVTSRFYPMSLIEFDTAEQRFSMLGYFMVNWTDAFLTWSPSDHGGTNNVKFPISDVWNPSLIILKAYDGNGIIGNVETDIVKVYSDGNVFWVPEGIYSVVCQVDIKYYPFDDQSCLMTYYVSDETLKSGVILDHELDVSLEHYTENSAWELINIEKHRYERFDSYFIDIKYNLRRRANFATFTMIMPLMMLAFLNICVFLVPIGSGEKGGFAITIFLSYGIFVTIVSDTLPHNSLQISLFVLFITVLLFLSVMSVFYTIVQAKLMSSCGDKECPYRCLRPKRTNPNRVIPLKGDGDGVDPEKGDNLGDVQENEDSYTWGMFLERLDTVLFFVFMGLIMLITGSFFCLLLRRVTEDQLK